MGEIGSIDLNSKKPYYLQVKELIQTSIERGALKPGDMLPSEIELCRELKVSRTVIRQALTELEHLGLLIKRKGKGSFVSESKTELLASILLPDFLWESEGLKLRPSVRVLTKETIPAPGQAARALKIKDGDTVLQVRRMYYYGEEAVILTKSFLPASVSKYLSDEDLLWPLQYLGKIPAALSFDHAEQFLEVASAEEADAKLLKITTGLPLLMVTTISYSKDNTPIEAYTTLLRSDRIRLRGTMFRYKERKTR